MSTMKADNRIDKKIHEEAKELMKLTNSSVDQAVVRARRLTAKYSHSAKAFNVAGMILSWVSDTSDKHKGLLQESCDTYQTAMHLAPSCVFTRLMYCKRLIRLHKFEETWKEFICIKTDISADPLDYTPFPALPSDIRDEDTPQKRCLVVARRCQIFKPMACHQLLLWLANEGAPLRARKLKQFTIASPEVVALHHANVVSSLLFACDSAQKCIEINGSGDDYYRRFLQSALQIAATAVNCHQASLVLSLYHARILFLLGQYDTAEKECIRGIRMEHPTDPINDKILYPGDENFHDRFQREIEVKGKTKDERVKCVKNELELLLGFICCRLKEHWSAIQTKHWAEILTSDLEALLSYYQDTNTSVAILLNEALDFFETNKQWDYWAELLIHATKVGCDQNIMLQDIESILWATPKGGEIQEETKEVKYTSDNYRWKHWHWLEKTNRGYKWFSDVPLPYSKDYKYTWLSGVDDDSDILSLAPANWKLAAYTHPNEFKVQTNDRRLVITDDEVPGSKSRLKYAWTTGRKLSSRMLWRVVTRKKSMIEAYREFNLLVGCQHRNILKPLGVWPCKDDPTSGYIMFPHVDGAISEVPKDTLYVEDNNVIHGFTKNGYTILRDILSVVQHVNIYYEHVEASRSLDGDEPSLDDDEPSLDDDEPSLDDDPLQLIPLDVSLDCIYYIRNAVGEYHVYLGNFSAESLPPQLVKACRRQRRGRRRKFIKANVLVRSNWNAVGTYLDMLCCGRSTDQEIAHLIDSLKSPSANYADLIWEPGLWTVSEKMMLLREVAWVLESDPEKVTELAGKPCLGIELFAIKVVLTEWKGKNMYNDIMTVRNKIVGHQSSVYHKYSGPKEEIGIDKATIMKLLWKEAPEFMLKLVEEIHALNWSIISPYRRSATSLKPSGKKPDRRFDRKKRNKPSSRLGLSDTV
uniref:Protein kinase domain-containing protein n=1 Tax=Leersia perrieri TaxID=77586 RepID=A0A0D9XW96_9ORYZ